MLRSFFFSFFSLVTRVMSVDRYSPVPPPPPDHSLKKNSFLKFGCRHAWCLLSVNYLSLTQGPDPISGTVVGQTDIDVTIRHAVCPPLCPTGFWHALFAHCPTVKSKSCLLPQRLYVSPHFRTTVPDTVLVDRDLHRVSADGRRWCERTIAQLPSGKEVVGLIHGGIGVHPGRGVRAVHWNKSPVKSERNMPNNKS